MKNLDGSLSEQFYSKYSSGLISIPKEFECSRQIIKGQHMMEAIHVLVWRMEPLTLEMIN